MNEDSALAIIEWQSGAVPAYGMQRDTVRAEIEPLPVPSQFSIAD
ncbi:hypothetical protein [Alicyclobacillus tolerans]|uniref:Uncharacterized protein n=1 Tax=Alicyclobacillus tolerans TaxID=90970 RepID=A0ABT9LTN9_9BACL|nr:MULTISPECIES: hypothetical protein [Alicyclobacillus]MDP9727624.1 hypothetical protein [Alicyclobacillus tengchongensis]